MKWLPSIPNMPNLRTGLPFNFRRIAAPPFNTPDMVKLQQQEFNWVFDWDNRVRNAPCAFPGDPLFTDQTFLMYLQNHEDGTPGLVFNHQMHRGFPGIPRAKLKGKLHPVTAEQMAELDAKCGNRVQSIRKRVRIIHANKFNGQPGTKLLYGEPIRTVAWMYLNNDKYWEPKFQYDQEHFRGHTKESVYLPCPQMDDHHPYIRRFYVPYYRVGFTPTLVQRQFNYRQFKVDLKNEYDAWREKEEEKQIVIINEQSSKPKASVS